MANSDHSLSTTIRCTFRNEVADRTESPAGAAFAGISDIAGALAQEPSSGELAISSADNKVARPLVEEKKLAAPSSRLEVMEHAPCDVEWREGEQLLVTRLDGGMSQRDAVAWSDTVGDALARVPDDTRFVWLADASRYQAIVTSEVHQTVREVVPRLLAAHGLRTTFASLHEAQEIEAAVVRGVRCRAVAHIHGDSEKMALFDEQLGSPVERFFSDADEGERWLASFQPEGATVDEPATIEPYRETWAQWFRQDRDQLLVTLGTDIAEAAWASEARSLCSYSESKQVEIERLMSL